MMWRRSGGIGAADNNIGELDVHKDERVGIDEGTQETRGTRNSPNSTLVDLVFVFDRLKGDERVRINDGTRGTRNLSMSMLVHLVFAFDRLKE